jgi:hypothetical protein
MSDDLLERLRSVDPARDDLVSAQARALGDLPGRIVAGESPVAGSTGLWPRVPRRAIAIGLAAVLLALGVAVPLALLRPLGGEKVAYGPLGDGWFRAGALAELRRNEVTLVRAAHAFVVAPPDAEPYALFSREPFGGPDLSGLLFCQSSGWFFSPNGWGQFDLHGNLETDGPFGMRSIPVRVVDGFVDLDQAHPSTNGAPPDGAGTDPQPSGPLCSEGFRRVRPGVVTATTHGPAIEVMSPSIDDAVSSPARLAGTADVFEATVSYRILGGRGQVLAEGFTTASCGNGCRGGYAARIPFKVNHSQPGTIQVFQVNAADGSETDLVEVPVTLAPPEHQPPPTTPPPSSNDAITVLGPLAGTTVSNPVTISGTADVFEAVVSYRILDEHGNVVADGTTMATCGSACRGDFSTRVRYSVDHEQPGTIQVFEVSSKDGSAVNVVEVPVTLSP